MQRLLRATPQRETVSRAAAKADTPQQASPAAAADGGTSAEAAWVHEAALALLAALGGRDNLVQLDAVAHTRLRVQVRDAARVDGNALRAAGADTSLQVAPGTYHLLLGDAAAAFAAALR